MEINKYPQPNVVVPDAIDVYSAERSTLSNGVSLYTLNCSEQEVMRFSFIFRAGTSTQDKPFSASATANLLSEGTSRHKAHEIAEILDFHGSYYNVSIDRDYAVVTFVTLLKFFSETLAVAREILLCPTFDQRELDIYKSKRKERLAIERSKIGVQGRELFGRALFGDSHPYGISYDEAKYDELNREDILKLYEKRYRAENCFVVCSGNICEKTKSEIAHVAESIPIGGETSEILFPQPDSRNFMFKPMDNAIQSSIRVGSLFFPRTHPDFIPMQVASTILGGYFGSRLVRNLREERGYTYGIYSTMVNLEKAGYFAISTEVATAATADALQQIFIEIDKLRTHIVDIEELNMVRNIMIGEVMRILDGPFGISDVTIENIQNKTDNSYLDKFLQEIRTISPERVREVAVKYMDPAKFTTAIVGHPSIEQELI